MGALSAARISDCRLLCTSLLCERVRTRPLVLCAVQWPVVGPRLCRCITAVVATLQFATTAGRKLVVLVKYEVGLYCTPYKSH